MSVRPQDGRFRGSRAHRTAAARTKLIRTAQHSAPTWGGAQYALALRRRLRAAANPRAESPIRQGGGHPHRPSSARRRWKPLDSRVLIRGIGLEVGDHHRCASPCSVPASSVGAGLKPSGFSASCIHRAGLSTMYRRMPLRLVSSRMMCS